MTLLLAGAMASLEPQHIEAARNLGAPRWRVLFDIVLPQVRGTLLVGLVLSFVTMLSVLSVPLMINPNSPTMITVDVAYRISTHGDYAVANALCLMSLVARGGRRVVLPAARGREGGDATMSAAVARLRAASCATLGVARCVLGAARVRDLRAARQPVAVGVRREVVLPEQDAAGVRLHVLGARVQPARQRAGVARHQRLDRAPDRGRQPRRRDSRGLCAGAAQAALARR